MTDVFDPAQPGASARHEADRLAAARLRRGDPYEPVSWRERAFRQGGDGEERLGRMLNEEAQRRGGVALLHDLVIAGRKANIDHLVVGPAGVTVIDAKAWTGRIWVGRAVVGQGRRGRRKPIDGMSRQLHRVHTVLAGGGRDDVVVDVAVCFVNANRGLSSRRLHEVEGVSVGTPRPVIEHAMRPGRHDLADVLAIQELLASHFVVQGGSVTPTSPATPGDVGAPERARPRVKRVRRSRRASTRAARGRRRAAALGLARLAIAAVAIAFLSGTVKPTTPTLPVAPAKLSRHQLNPLLPALTRLAQRRAHGKVRRAGITRHRDRFVLRFRRGPACVVTITVPRMTTAPVAAAHASTARCRR
jgi:hypothetical protein